MNLKTAITPLLPRRIVEIKRHLSMRSHQKKLSRCLSVSQAGQDHWVYGEVFNERSEGFFLDVGAHDGCFLSNTFILEKRYNWNGICVEGNPSTYINLEKNRSCKCINECVDNKQGVVEFALRGIMGGIIAPDLDNTDSNDVKTAKVDARPLVDILKESGAPNLIDYFSIDIEGAEDRALLNFPFSEYSFNCITIERPSNKLRSLLNDNEYVLIKEIPNLDCFYMHKSFIPQYKKNVLAYGKKKFLTKQWY